MPPALTWLSFAFCANLIPLEEYSARTAARDQDELLIALTELTGVKLPG